MSTAEISKEEIIALLDVIARHLRGLLQAVEKLRDKHES